MKKIIHHLRKKPHEDRRHILHIALFVCFLLLISLFSYTLNANFRKNSDDLRDDLAEFQDLKEDLSQDYQDFSNDN